MGQAVDCALSKLADFVELHLPILNAHMVSFFTDEVWQLLNENLQADLLQLNSEQCAQLPYELFNFHLKSSSHIGLSLHNLLSSIHQHSLKSLNVTSTTEQVLDQLQAAAPPALLAVPFEEFMTEKKSHEVSSLCDIISPLALHCKTDILIDLGCGKGALGSVMSLQNDVTVWGIDAAGFNSHAEQNRQSKLEKTFNTHIKKHPSPHLQQAEATKKQLKFHRVTQYLSPDLKLSTIIDECQSHFGRTFCNPAIVGLHTCGNLASTSLRLFTSSPQAAFLCNVGCCYHFLDESSSVHAGFPMSQTLLNRRFQLGRNARMVSSQPLERLATSYKLPPAVIFYRALLQVILVDRNQPTTDFQVGRLRKPVSNFAEYFRWATRKLDLQVTDEELNDYLVRYEAEQHKKLTAFFQLRLLLAPLVEALILVDRLAFLLQQESVSHAFLVEVFSAVTSPRCYALMAFKKAIV